MASEHQTVQYAEVTQLLAKLRHLDLTGSVHYDSTFPISQGGFGDVYKGRYRRKDGTDGHVAIKRLRIYLDGGRDAARIFRREIRAWSRLNHPNILPLAGYTLEETGGPSCLPALVSEWMENGDILEFVKGNPDCDVLMLTLGMAEGLSYLHANKIVHSDFKSGNVLISSTHEVLISDFGAAHVSYDSQAAGISSTVTGTRGTSRWLAYELLANSEQYQNATKESDVWSFGMTLLEVLTGDQPYSHLKRDGQVMFAITQKILPPPPANLGSGGRDQLWAVCMNCWSWEPTQRLAMDGIAIWIKAIPRMLQTSEPAIMPAQVEQTYPSSTFSNNTHASLDDGLSLDSSESGLWDRAQSMGTEDAQVAIEQQNTYFPQARKALSKRRKVNVFQSGAANISRHRVVWDKRGTRQPSFDKESEAPPTNNTSTIRSAEPLLNRTINSIDIESIPAQDPLEATLALRNNVDVFTDEATDV